MTRTTPRAALAAATVLALAPLALTATADAHGSHQLPRTYQLDGDPADPAGSKFEGIGVDRKQRTFYVSETTGGEIHRGNVLTGRTQVWLDEGEDGRVTARGITTDRHGRVYIAGGPNSTTGGTGDMWVYGSRGRLHATLSVGVENPFVNDVTIGPDGAAYFTNSNAPVVYRVAFARGGWRVTTWADATGVIPVEEGFNLGGIVVSPDRKALIVAQGNVGRLWRFDLATTEVTPVDVGDADLTDADGLVLRGHKLLVIRNFSQSIAVLRVDHGGTTARLVKERATDPDRVFTTGKIARGRLLLVDSKFDEEVAAPPYQVVALRLHHRHHHRHHH